MLMIRVMVGGRNISQSAGHLGDIGVVSRDGDFIWNIMLNMAEGAAQCILEVWILK